MNEIKWAKGPTNDECALYRGYYIEHNPPPIPHRGADWQFVHKDYDGPEDDRCGTAASLEEAKELIDEKEDD